jgi:hypothetical protein
MNIIKKKYVMSLAFDLVLLLVGSGLLYRLSLNLLESTSVNNLLFVIINSVIIGSVLLDIVFEYIMYRRVIRTIKDFMAFNDRLNEAENYHSEE